jgi:hypothetical protein
MGPGWKQKEQDALFLLDQIDWLKRTLSSEQDIGKVADIDQEIASMANLLLGTVGVVRGVARGMISKAYALADRMTSIGTTYWKHYGPEEAKQILGKAMIDPQYAELLRMKVNKTNMRRLEAFYNANVYTGGEQIEATDRRQEERKPITEPAWGIGGFGL